MRLFRAELSRLCSRRAVVLLVLAAALLTVAMAANEAWDTRPPSRQELASARAQVDQQVASSQFRHDLASCRENPAEMFGPRATAADCEELRPSPQDYVGRGTLSLDGARTGSGLGLAVLLVALMVILGATYAGADWASGSMSNQLLFETRRGRVWAAKAVAVLLGTAVVAAVLLVAFWLGLYLVAQGRGLATGAGVQSEVRWLVARSVALAAAAALGAYAATMLLRSTVATLAILFAYAAGGEALLALLPVERPGRWSPTSAVFAWLRDGVTVFDPSVRCLPGSSGCSQEYTVTLLHGATYLGVLLVLATVVSVLVFRRRDVP